MKNYSPDPKEHEDNTNPFNPQIQHFGFIGGHLLKENKILRFMVVGAVIALLLSIALNFYAVSLPDSIPVVVTMNELGETRYVGEISRKNYQNFSVPEVAIVSVVRQFIEIYWSLSTDKIVMNRNFNRIYKYLTQTTSNKYTTLLKEQNLFEGFGEKTREVFFQTEPLKLSHDTYQVDFEIIERSIYGNLNERYVYRAVITVKTLQPAKEDIMENPLGIYITNFDWKKVEKNDK